MKLIVRAGAKQFILLKKLNDLLFAQELWHSERTYLEISCKNC